jgi:hypothetical protein
MLMRSALALALLALASPAWPAAHGSAPLGTVVISAISSGTPTSTGATITWTNTPPALGKVCYGLTNAYEIGCTPIDTTQVTSDTASISGLTSNELYHYQIIAAKPGYYTGISADQTFVTGFPSGCPYATAPLDGCGVSAGLYYAPTTGPADPTVPVAQPTWTAFSTYVRQSGQTWTATHTPGGGAPNVAQNVAGVDYAIGPNQLVSSMVDIAGWNTSKCTGTPVVCSGGGSGTAAWAASQCIYLSAADGFNGTTGAAWTGTAHAAGGTLTVDSTTSGTLTAGMQLVPGPSGVGGQNYVVAGSGTSFTISRTTTIGSEAMSATNTFFGPSGTWGWKQGYPLLVCTGNSQPDFVINGWNFGATAYQATPVGTHDCVGVMFTNTNAAYAPNISVTNNAFINGATCSPYLAGIHYGMLNAPSAIKANFTIWNNFVWGRNKDTTCCVVPTNQGFFVAMIQLQSNIDIEFNWIYQNPSNAALIGFNTGNEATYPCANGTAYTTPGYVQTFKYNYVDDFGTLYGGAHAEVITIGSSLSSAGVCAIYDDYNTVLWPGTMPDEGGATFFGYTTGSNVGVAEYFEVENNLIITNLVGGKTCTGGTSSVCSRYEYYNWHTDGGSPVNHIVIDGPSASNCAGIAWGCTGVASGVGILGGTGNTYASQVGLQGIQSGTPLAGVFNAGCNALDNAANGICRAAGNYPALTAGVAYGPVTASVFGYWTTSIVAAETSHGALGLSTTPVVAGGPYNSSSTAITLAATCPTNFAYANVIDTSQANALVGVIKLCTGVSLTLYSNNGVTLVNGDHLKFAYWGYGATNYVNNYIDGTGGGAATDPSYQNYWNTKASIVSGGYNAGGSGGCATPVVISGNIEMTGVIGSTPNTSVDTDGGC